MEFCEVNRILDMHLQCNPQWAMFSAVRGAAVCFLVFHFVQSQVQHFATELGRVVV
jgi:hypothetical protein